MSNGVQIDTLQQFGHSFQTKVIAALLTDSKFLDSLSDIIHIKFFESATNKWIVGEIIDYQSQYKKPPSMDVFKVQVSKLTDEILKKTVVDQLRHIYTNVGNVDMDYIKDQFSNFCINQNLKEVILKSVDLLKIGSYDKIKELTDNALKVGTTVDLGHNYTEDYADRYDEDKRTTIKTAWDVINDLMGGGLGPGELGVVVAPSGVGKCIGGDSSIEIQYEEIGFELANGFILWCKPWQVIQLNDDISITAKQAQLLITTNGKGKTM